RELLSRLRFLPGSTRTGSRGEYSRLPVAHVARAPGSGVVAVRCGAGQILPLAAALLPNPAPVRAGSAATTRTCCWRAAPDSGSGLALHRIREARRRLLLLCVSFRKSPRLVLPP